MKSCQILKKDNCMMIMENKELKMEDLQEEEDLVDCLKCSVEEVKNNQDLEKENLNLFK